MNILPCPFCGDEATLNTVTLPLVADCSDICVTCGNCDAAGPSVLFDNDAHNRDDLPALETEAIMAWNTRKASAGMRDALKAIAQLPTGKNEDVEEGHEQAYRAIEALVANSPPDALRKAAERCIKIVENNLYRQHEKIEDVPKILRSALNKD